MLLPFTKAHGTGNSFIIIYLPECPYLKLNEKIIKTLCKSNSTPSIDGLLTLEQDDKYDFKMDYYNNDGTWETMCVNGARCAGLLLYEKKHSCFISGDGPHEMIIHDENNIELTIFPPEYTSNEITIDGLSGFSVNSGAKHFVIEVDADCNIDWEAVGKKIRFSNNFAPHGTNVNFVKKISSKILEVITYEKGVEQIMESCGSGSVAAAYHMQKKYNLDNNLTINVKGGILTIKTDENWKNVWLQGPAKLISNSTVNIEPINEI